MYNESVYIEDTTDEIEAYIANIESDILSLANEYLATLDTESGKLLSTQKNYDIAANSDTVFNKAFDTFIGGFLIFLASKIIKGVDMVTANMSGDGISPIGDEYSVVSSMIGIKGGNIIRGGYLHRLGQMSALRTKFYNFLLGGVSQGVTITNAMRNLKPIFVSTGKRESDFARLFRTYAYDSIMQTMNAIALRIADKNGLNRFLYQGGLIKDSRDFCVEHAGNIYTRSDAKDFDTMDWRGKNRELPFLIAVGGWNCKHFIKWLPNE